MNLDSKKYILPLFSEEQIHVIDHVSSGKNINVDSVAGSGKTTTILGVAKKMTSSKILLLTYNAKLKIETRNKVQLLGFLNLEVHSYHSFGVKYYSNKCRNDYGIITVVNDNLKSNNGVCYNIIILDELQDMTPLYYKFTRKIIKDNNNKLLQLCVLGDKHQSIYEFNKADSRFIVYTDLLFPMLKQEWKFLKLSCSFRITHQISNFINKCVLKHNRLNAQKSGPLVRYVICNTFMGVVLFKELKMYITQYSLEDIFILAPSVRSIKSPVRTLANIATKFKINIYVPNNDEEKIDEDIIKGKIVFATFHQVKGLERKVCMIFNFDSSYFTYYKKNSDKTECPNEIYVALTRSSECITVFHHNTNNYLDCINPDEIIKNASLITHTPLKIKNTISEKSTTITITELTRHLPSTILDSCMKLLVCNKIKDKSYKNINIPIKITQSGGTHEFVGEITSIAVPAYYEYQTTGKMTIFNKLIEIKGFTLPNVNKTNELLILSNRYCSHETGYTYKLSQITDYSWLSKINLMKCCSRLKKWISNKAKYEVHTQYFSILYNKIIVGSINCHDNDTIWMFKCLPKITSEHIIQFAVQIYCNEKYNKLYKKSNIDALLKNKKNIYKREHKIKTFSDRLKFITDLVNIDNKLNPILHRKYKIINILTHEIYELDFRISNIEQMMQLLLESKFGNNKNKVTDQKFVASMLQSIN